MYKTIKNHIVTNHKHSYNIKLQRYFYLSLIIIASLFCNTKTIGQVNPLEFEHLLVNHGLSNGVVRAILQDSKGYMWFGTHDGGLIRYNGYDYTNFVHNGLNKNSISGHEISCLIEDNEKNIWIGTLKSGLNKFDYKTEKFHRYTYTQTDSTPILDNRVNNICKDSKGNLWIATKQGLSSYNFSQNRFKHHKLPSNNVRSLIFANDSLLWLGTNNGIISYNTYSNTVIAHFTNNKNDKYSLNSNNILSLIIDQKKQLWIGTSASTLCCLKNPDKGIFTSFYIKGQYTQSVYKNKIRTLYQDTNGTLWIGTQTGLVQFNIDQQECKAPTFIFHVLDKYDKKSLSQNSIYSFYADHQGDFWIGTWEGAINYLYNGQRKFENYKFKSNKENNHSGRNVRGISVNNDSIWIATDKNGVKLINRESGKVIVFKKDKNNKHSLINNRTKSLFIDTDKDVWIGTQTGISLLKRGNENFQHFLQNKNISSIIEGKHGEIWVGSSKNLYVINKNTGQIKSYLSKINDTTSISHRAIHFLFKDSQNRIWIGSRIGLNLYNRTQDNFKQFKNNLFNLSNNRINSICEDRLGNIWIGTMNGLNKYDSVNNNFIQYNSDNGLPYTVIKNLLPDNNGNLWFTSIRSLVKFNPNCNNHNNCTRSYNEEDGLQGSEFNRNTCFKSNTGEFYYGGTNGFNIFDPNNVLDSKYIPKIVFTHFKLFNKNTENSPLIEPFWASKEITLNHKQSVFSIGFVAFNYYSPDKTQYAYKMEGFNDEWNYVGTSREATYTNLKAGKYKFRVKAANNDMVWDEQGIAINITVLPPWWETWWFRILSFIIFIAITLGYYFKKINSLKKLQRNLEIKVKERTNELELANDELSENNQEISCQKEEIISQRDYIEKQRDKAVERTNKLAFYKQRIDDNVSYASLIQRSVLPPKKSMDEIVDNYFVWLQPLDIVSGDFYFARKVNNKSIVAAIDCTGHGISGALLSMLGMSLFVDVVDNQNYNNAADILELVRESLKRILNQTGGDEDLTSDGMDCALCIIDYENKTLDFAGANNPLILIRNNEIVQYKGNNMPLGIHYSKEDPFTNNHISLEQNDMLYIFSDGYQDQFGGADKQRLMGRRFKTYLYQVHSLPLNEQKEKLKQLLDEWKGKQKQIDDILIMGLKIT